MTETRLEIARKNTVEDLAEGIKSLEQHVKDYLAQYEYRHSDAGGHFPTEMEHILIGDAIAGLIADAEFCDMVALMVARQKMLRAMDEYK